MRKTDLCCSENSDKTIESKKDCVSEPNLSQLAVLNIFDLTEYTIDQMKPY